MTALGPALGPALAKTGEAAKSGPIGLAVILLLCIACYFLFKSMSKHLRTVRESQRMDWTSTPPSAESTLESSRVADSDADASRADSVTGDGASPEHTVGSPHDAPVLADQPPPEVGESSGDRTR